MSPLELRRVCVGASVVDSVDGYVGVCVGASSWVPPFSLYLCCRPFRRNRQMRVPSHVIMYGLGSLFTSYLSLTPFRSSILWRQRPPHRGVGGVGGPHIRYGILLSLSWGPLEIYGGYGTCISIYPHGPT